jgi:6-hydroxycyclohex-1-ene-1-carbonyl-CoA dehydrogenase
MTGFFGYEMVESGRPLRRVERDVPAPGPEEALVRVAGCGVCHTDIGYYAQGVRTRHPLPLILGHEISGYVDDAGPRFRDLVGSAVVVPAVIPCGECSECRGGRPTICRAQVMPGNDRDGGFASHVLVPARSLCPVPGATSDPDAPISGRTTLRHLAVVADAVSTAYQSVVRSGLEQGSVAVVVGLGGVGGYAAQIALDRRAAVVGIDIDADRRASAKARGAAAVIDPQGSSPKEIRARIQEAAKQAGAPGWGWVILECSGTPAGQSLAYGLLVPGAKLMVVGFTMEPVSIRLSNLMAFDAAAVGNWGCDPQHYPRIVDMALAGRIDVVSDTEVRPLSGIEATLSGIQSHAVKGRVVLAP